MFEKVNPSHPDKVADRIAGAIVDLCYTKSRNRWSKQWPNWTGVVPQVGDTVLLNFGDYNEECVPCNVVKRYIDGTNPDVVTCLIEE